MRRSLLILLVLDVVVAIFLIVRTVSLTEIDGLVIAAPMLVINAAFLYYALRSRLHTLSATSRDEEFRRLLEEHRKHDT